MRGASLLAGAHGARENRRMSEVSKRFRVLVMAPLLPGSAYATSGTLPPRTIHLDGAGDLDRLLANVGTRVKLDVADPLGSASDKVRIDVAIRDVKSLRPDGLVAEVPVLKALIAARGAVLDLVRRGASRSEAASELERVLGRPAWAASLASVIPAGKGAGGGGGSSGSGPSAPAHVAASVDALLSQVEVAPPEDPGAQKRAMSSLIADVVRGGSGSASGAGTAAERIDRALADILYGVLDHPELHRLERAIRGLRFFAASAGKGAQIDVVPFAPGEAALALAHLGDLAERGELAPDLVIFDLETGGSAADLALVDAAGELASAMRAPLVVSGAASLTTADEERDLRLVALGKEEWAAWVAIAVNGALVRGPYEKENARVRELVVPQRPETPGARVFASAAYVLGALAARSYETFSWASAIAGAEDGVMGGFEVHAKDATSSALATEVLVGPEAAQKHARRGLTVLTSVPNRDNVACVGAPTLARAAAADAPTLGDQLFVARLAGVVAQLGLAIPKGVDPKAAADTAAVVIADLLPQNGPRAPSVEAAIEGDTLVVTVIPKRFAGTSLGEITLGAPLGDAEG
jgi:type VI secretion system ImpB/VipA family protein